MSSPARHVVVPQKLAAHQPLRVGQVHEDGVEHAGRAILLVERRGDEGGVHLRHGAHAAWLGLGLGLG